VTGSLPKTVTTPFRSLYTPNLRPKRLK